MNPRVALGITVGASSVLIGLICVAIRVCSANQAEQARARDAELKAIDFELRSPSAHRDRFATIAKAVLTQPVNQAWALPTNEALGRQINALGQGRFSAVHVDCHASACAAVVEWPNYGAAQAEFGELLRGHYAVNCAREIFLDETSDPNARYQATLLLTECKE